MPTATKEIAIQVAQQAICGLVDWPKSWHRVSPVAVRRGTVKGSLIVIACMLQSAVWSTWFAVTLLPGFPLVFLLNRQWYRHTGYRVTEDHLLFRKGWLNRSTLCLPIANIQNVQLSRSPFDRRLGLASLSIDTAGQSNTGGGPVMHNLPLWTAARIRRRLTRQISVTPFSW